MNDQSYKNDNSLDNVVSGINGAENVEENKRKFPVTGSKSWSMVRMVVLAAGIALVVIGVCRGDYLDVMNKAIRICYECIGIG